MNTNQLLKKFNQALFWNFSLYSIQRLLSLSLSIFLYKKLPINEFSLWANITSIIFLFLLWIDFGFKKSLPLFLPSFNHKNDIKKFIKIILLFKTTTLFLITPLFLLSINTIIHSHNSFIEKKLYFMFLLLFITEGITSTIKLLYHSHFKNKEFNLISSIVKTIQVCSTLFIIFFIKNRSILFTVFFINIITKLFLIFFSFYKLNIIYKNKVCSKQLKNLNYKLLKTFFTHSAAIWLTTNIKSLTERNFLLPLITYLFTPEQGNIFKIAHDGAVFFQRIILKTIGSSDTSLFAHIKTLRNGEKNLPHAFTKITKKLLWLCFPVLGFLMPLIIYQQQLYLKEIQLFSIITFSYLLEILVSPYERILETKKMYFILFWTYTPFLFLIIFAFLYNIKPFNFIFVIGIIQTIRLVNAYSIAYIVYKKFHLNYPFSLMIKLFLTSVISSTLIKIFI